MIEGSILRGRTRARRLADEIEVTHHDVELAHLPKRMAGTTIAQISDLHRGKGNADPIIQAAVTRANSLHADFIVVTGDFCNGPKRDVLPTVKMVAALRARRGIYASLGNHDHRGDPILLTSALEAAGFTVLTNRAAEIEPGFWLAGVDDLYEGQPDLEAALRDVPHDAACILLSHHPGAFDRVDQHRPLVILSGHTHGGQIRLRFPKPETVCWHHLRTRYVDGWFQRGALRLYVNRGIGVTGPAPLALRHNCPPEITLFRLFPA